MQRTRAASCDRIATRLDHPVQLNTPVSAIAEHERGVDVQTATGTRVHAAAALVTVPLPALCQLDIKPTPPTAWRATVKNLRYGQDTKISVLSCAPSPVRHRAVLGGTPLVIAWRRGTSLAGIATGPGPHRTDDLAEGLATAFGLRTDALAGIAVTDWTNQPHIAGSYLACAPGQLTRHIPVLRDGHTPRVRYAGADQSRWPNSMEGAVHSGQAAAEMLLHDTRIRRWPNLALCSATRRSRLRHPLWRGIRTALPRDDVVSGRAGAGGQHGRRAPSR